MRVEPYLEAIGSQAVEQATGTPAPALLRPSKDPAHGDYQLNAAMALGKKLGRPPREIASEIAEQLRTSDAFEAVEVAGPGFVNLRLSLGWLGKTLAAALADRERDGVPAAEPKLRVIIDFSAPNIAKQMHVGHLRSTILGDALCRLYRFVGHDVIGDNHIGDWGTQFGLLIVGMRSDGDPVALERDPVAELERVYAIASNRAKDDPEVAEAARRELAKLQAGDRENRAQWERFVAVSRKQLDVIYERLDVHFDQWMGESAYEPMLPDVVQMLLDRGIAREDQGAVCIFFDDDPELARGDTPMIVRKRDGAYLYATTDIATLLDRRDRFDAERVLYVVDPRQALHFKQLFSTARKLGLSMQLEHVSFGTVLGADGKPLRTRDGGTIKLRELLDEAEARARARIVDEGIQVAESELASLASIVGIGAVKYADLSQHRTSDYRFDWDKMISFKGDAGPYLQYAHARICAIFRKGEIEPEGELQGVVPVLAHEAEIALGKRLLRFADVVHQATEANLPHLVCEHLYALAKTFSTFYEQCPVLAADGTTRTSRLALAWLVARQLARGLALLGIRAPSRM